MIYLSFLVFSCIILNGLAVDTWDKPEILLVSTAVGAIALVALIVTGIRIAFYRCPRCGGLFSSSFFYSNAFARRCLHCGLKKWAPAGDTASNSGSRITPYRPTRLHLGIRFLPLVVAPVAFLVDFLCGDRDGYALTVIGAALIITGIGESVFLYRRVLWRKSGQ